MTSDSRPVRVRIAPGPTGPFHIGRSRAAVLNWLFARHHGGVFVLRIEDTDQQRSKPQHLQGILDSLRWLGMQWDEGPDVGGPYGPYFQMGRLDTYRPYVERLLTSGHAYHCYCTSEELGEARELAQKEHRAYRYARTCRYLTPGEREERNARGLPSVVRLAIEDGGITSFEDMVLGTVSVENSELDDFVLVRDSGIPTYNFAVVVDDLTMHISHVIRGQDHVPNTPRQVLVYRYLDEELPIFAHLPMVLGEDKSKLSARHGAQPVTSYARDGFLSDAIVNYLATLGASYDGEKEIFDRDELVTVFDLNKLGRSGATFSDEKLEWMNGMFIRKLSLEEFVRGSLPYLELRGLIGTPPTDAECAHAKAALALEQERVRTLAETPDAVEFFFQSDLVYDPLNLIGKGASKEDALHILDLSLEAVEQAAEFSHDELEGLFRALAGSLELKTGVVFGTVRVAITGRTAAPPLFDTMVVLGRERVASRLRKARKSLAEIPA